MANFVDKTRYQREILNVINQIIDSAHTLDGLSYPTIEAWRRHNKISNEVYRYIIDLAVKFTGKTDLYTGRVLAIDLPTPKDFERNLSRLFEKGK